MSFFTGTATQDFPGTTRPGMLSRMGSAYSSYTNSLPHFHGKQALRISAGMSYMKEGKVSQLSGIGKWLPRGIYGFSALQGYSREGLWGAAKGVARDATINYALGAAYGAIGGLPTMAVGAGIAATIGVGIMAASGANPVNAYVNEYTKKHSQLEMGAPAIDNFGTAATMRQRSVNAIQSSRINGRNALGNESSLTFSPYFR